MLTSSSLQKGNLKRTLSALETYGFGLAGPPGWIGLVILMHIALGAAAIWVWVPAALVGALINYQVKHLGTQMTDVVGGTPNYITRLLRRYPVLARYAAFGYLLNWISAIAMNAIILTDIIQSQLKPLGLEWPGLLMRLSFILLPFIVAFSGTRALSILHVFLVVPAIGLLFMFGEQGLSWLAFSPESPGFFPDQFPQLSFTDWAKWFLLATYATYSSETASSFAAESCQPSKTLRFLDVVAWLGVFIFLADSWVVACLAKDPSLNGDTVLALTAVAQPFWGQAAPLLVIFLTASLCLLVSATAVSNCPRIFYQMAQDDLLAPVFGIVSLRGVFGPALLLTLAIALTFLVSGHLDQVIIIGNISWFVTFMLLHLMVWLRRSQIKAVFPHLTLAIFFLEASILVVGGTAWGWQSFLLGLVAPFAMMILDKVVQTTPFAPFKPAWWYQRYYQRSQPLVKDPLMSQVSILILLLSGAVLAGWRFRDLLDRSATPQGSHLVLVLLMIVVFIGISIACWTSLPQFIATIEARELAERAHAELQLQKQQLQRSLDELQRTQSQLVQTEKMSSLGQLVAGVAHEINNPVNFIYGNLTYTSEYATNLLALLSLYQSHFPEPPLKIREKEEEIDLEFLMQDFPKIISSMRMGAERIQKIVVSLRNFSRMDEAEFKEVNIHDGIDSTLVILQNRLKAKSTRPEIQVIKHYAPLPEIECYPGQLNQVFMNLLSNAIDALEEKISLKKQACNPFEPKITIHTELLDENQVVIRFVDNGLGMPEQVRQRLFDPFFTTKPVGKGTGMGLSISYQVITEQHNGSINCFSEPGSGSEFTVEIPIRQSSKVIQPHLPQDDTPTVISGIARLGVPIPGLADATAQPPATSSVKLQVSHNAPFR